MKFPRALHLISIQSTAQWKALLFAAFVLTVFGAKLWLIAHYGNATPFWDEWDGQAAYLFIPYFDSTLSLQQLLAPHNEHRLLTTRIVSLLLIVANGLWDPILQMIVNAAIHVALGVCILTVFGNYLDRAALAALTILTLILIAVPFAAENPLMAFQTHFYCTLLFGFAAICLIGGGTGCTVLRIMGLAAAGLSFMSLASGALVFLASMGVVIAKRLLGVEKGWQPWVCAAVLLVCFIIALSVTPTVGDHKAMAAHSVRQFFGAFLALASWPLTPHVAVGALVVNAPLLLFTWHTLRRPPPAYSPAWVLLGIGLWNGLAFAALAYGRADGIGASRYLDICAVTVIVNCVCATVTWNSGRSRLLFVGWLGVIVFGLVDYGTKNVPQQLRERYSTSIQQERNVKAFLGTGQFLPGASGRDFSLPYPDAKRLADLLSDERVRQFLPSNLQAAIAAGRTPVEASARLDRLGEFRDGLLAAGPYLTLSGLLLLLTLLVGVKASSTDGTNRSA